MANIARLKEQARSLELKEQWKAALEVYERIIEESDGEDSGLWNRLGDVRTRLGQSEPAVEAYERAVDLYVEAGLHNNAIALCNKILRVAPNRAPTYLRLGQISAAQGFLADARHSFLQYAERMQRAGKLDESFAALGEFAALSPDDVDVRRLFADQLRTHGREAEALEHLRALHALLAGAGEADAAEAVRTEMLALDPQAEPDASTAAPHRSSRPAVDEDEDGGLLPMFEISTAQPPAAAPDEPAVELEAEPAAESPGEIEFHIDTDAVAAPEGLEPTHLEDDHVGPEPDELRLDAGATADDGDGDDLGLISGFEHPAGAASDDDAEADEAEPLGDFELPLLDAFEPGAALPEAELEADQGEVAPLEGFESTLHEPAEEGALPLLTGFEGDAPAGEVDEADGGAVPEVVLDETPLLDELDSAITGAVGDPLDALRDALERAPLDASARAPLVEVLFERGRGAEAESALEEAHRALAAEDRFAEALAVLRALVALRSDDLALYQKQVEYAFRASDRPLLIEAYLALAARMEAEGNAEKAKAIYERVLELDADDATARAALAPRPSAGRKPRAGDGDGESGGDYVDLAALIFDDEEDGEPSTRFVVPEEEPTGDEARDFADMLAVFKQKVAANIDATDSTSHYDLGLAFKDMGLLDEAIAQFQVALRGGANPLATLEVLGECFVEKDQPTLGTRVLERALRLPGASDASLIGVHYWLGRCAEALDDNSAAGDHYERVVSLDIRFRDAAARLGAMRNARSGAAFDKGPRAG